MTLYNTSYWPMFLLIGQRQLARHFAENEYKSAKVDAARTQAANSTESTAPVT
jgi:hypothetical protein